MEPRNVPGERMPHVSQPGEGADATSKESKNKKSANSNEFLAATAIKDIKRPEGVPESPKNNTDGLKAEQTWLGSTDHGHDDKQPEAVTAADTDKTDTSHESEAHYANDVDHLTHGEALSVVAEYVDHRLPIIKQERTESRDDIHELAAIDANEAFLTRMQTELGEEEVPEAPPEVLIDQAMGDIIRELGLEDTVANREAEDVEPNDATSEMSLPDTSEHASAELPEMPDMHHTAEDGDGGEPPVTAERPSFDGDDEPGMPPHIGLGHVEPEPAREINPMPPAPNIRLERAQRGAERQQDMLRGMLVGGVIGYIVGRRRGRIKTEQKFKPVQEKLQQEADGLRKAVATHEQTIRSMAREKSTLQQTVTEALAQTVTEAQNGPASAARSVSSAKGQKTVEEIKDSAINTILAAPAKPLEHSPALHAEVARREVASYQQTVERSPGGAVDIIATPTKQQERVVTPRTVESMPLPTLIKASESVIIGGTSLKKYFESGRIGEQGMRRVLAEHVRTGKTEQALNTEMFSYERRKTTVPERLDTTGHNGAQHAITGMSADIQQSSHHTPQSALVADSGGSRIVPPVKVQKPKRTVSAMVVVISIILLIGVLFLALH